MTSKVTGEFETVRVRDSVRVTFEHRHENKSCSVWREWVNERLWDWESEIWFPAFVWHSNIQRLKRRNNPPQLAVLAVGSPHVPVDPSPRDPVREAGVDLPSVRPGRGRGHHQEGAGECDGWGLRTHGTCHEDSEGTRDFITCFSLPFYGFVPVLGQMMQLQFNKAFIYQVPKLLIGITY